MADSLELFFDPDAEAQVRALWRRLDEAGIASMASRVSRPHLTLAAAGTIPQAARRALRSELSVLALPNLWLHTLGTFPAEEPALLFGAVVDTELLAVHSAVHDVLAGAVRAPSAYYFPGTWVPHCVLARGLSTAELTAGFSALQPAEPIRASISEIGITDTRTGEIETLRRS